MLEGHEPTIGPENQTLKGSDQPEKDSRIPGHYIVVLKDSVDRPGVVAKNQTARRGGDLGSVYWAALKGYAVSQLSRDDVEALRSDPRVKYVVPDLKREEFAQTIPTGISRISATGNEALDIDGNDDIRVNADVAVLDGGIDYTHPDLNVAGRTDCTLESGKCIDGTGGYGTGHGTHVAGTIGALDNGIGVVGVAPGVRLWAVKVLNENGGGSAADIISGIDWVTAHASTIEVANMSLGGFGTSAPEEAAIKASVEAGVVYTVAASNEGLNTDTVSPASYPDVITVSALADYDGTPGGKGSPTCWYSPDDTLLDYSDWGSDVEIAAPGTCIYSTLPSGQYGTKSGTSMAAPHVAGAAAFLASKANPNSKADVESIRKSLIDGGSLDWGDTSEDGEVEPLLYLDDEPIVKPEVATAGWSSNASTSATLYGSINPRGLEATYQFEYGSTAGYGQVSPASPAQLPASSRYVGASQAIGGLKPDQTYHYRLTTTTSAGKIVGADRTFETSRWGNQPSPDKPEGSEEEWFTDLSCTSATACMGVGHYYASGNLAGAYRLVGSSWSFSKMPLPEEGHNAAVHGVSCIAANQCMAVGGVIDKNAKVISLVDKWDGSKWTTEAVPAPYSGAPYTELEDVSCWSATECMAVGYYKDVSGTFLNYAALWKSGSWSNVLPPNSSGVTQSLLEGVSCSSATSCVAVGWSNGGGSKPVIVRWNGASWSLQSSARAEGWLDNVACTSSEWCMAVGGGYGEVPAAEVWNGSSWSTRTVETPSHGGELRTVSCASASSCKAVGISWIGYRPSSLIETWDGNAWQVEAMPRDAEVSDELLGLSCAGLSGCLSAGGANQSVWETLVAQRSSVVTEEAESITPSHATLNGSVDPGGVQTSYHFEYGTTTSYGTSVPVPDSSAGSGVTPLAVSQEAVELQAETVYHYRLVASNGKDVVYGKDRTFRTVAPSPEFKFSFGSSGSGSGQVKYPLGTAVDASGNVWVADSGNNRVEEFDSTGKFVLMLGGEVNKTTHANICTAASGNTCGAGIAGSGNGQFKKPADIAFTSGGDIWVTDAENNRVQKFNSKGEYLSKFGSEGTGNGQFTEPWGLDIGPNGHIWVADSRYYRVEEFTAGGEFVSAVHGAGYGGSGPAEFWHPEGMAVDLNGHVWVADSRNNRVQELSSSGQYLSQFGSQGTGDGQFEEPSALAIKPPGDLLVTDDRTARVEEFAPTGEYVGQFGSKGTGAGKFVEPRGIAVAPGGTVYVSDSGNDRLEKWQIPLAPEAVTKAASSIYSTSATLAGTINPGGYESKYKFEYGPTAAYGSSAPVPSQSAGSGSEVVQKTASIGGLSPTTTYHFRIVASNANGTTYGKDEVFTTAEAAGPKLGGMAVTEPFNGSSGSLAEFSANWSALGWAGGSSPKGEDTTAGWRPVDSYSTVNGAYYKSIVTDTGPGVAAVATMAANPGNASRYFSVWLDASGSASTRSGYELRFTYVSTNTYNVALSKWQGGTQTVLASKSNYSFANGNSFAVADEGATVSAWTNTGSGFGQLLSAGDSSFGSGNAGVEGSGSNTRLTNFKVGSLLTPVANMNAALSSLALTDSFGTNESPLSGGGAWAALSWDNGGSGNNTGRVLGGWGPYDAYSAVNGAYWTKAGVPDTGAGVGVAATLTTVPTTSRYFSLGLDMPSPSSAHTGYELRFTQTGSGVYEVLLCKWQSGSKTTLASKTGYSFSTGNKLALVDKGGTVSVWTKTGSEYTQLLTASDTAFNGGYVGVEGSGNLTRLTDFRSGPLAPF